MPNPTTTKKAILIASIFVVGLCSIIYELLISATSSYFLGDSIKQFSIIIGVYMAAMGLGAYLSRFMERGAMARFIEVEIILGVIGGVSVPFLYFTFSQIDYAGFNWIVIALIGVIGMLTGLEIPLLNRVMEEHYPKDKNLSNVLSLDYLGALAATMLFPFFLLPWVGVFKSSILFGFVNVCVGMMNLWVFADLLPARRKKWYWSASFAVAGLFSILFPLSGKMLGKWHDGLFRDRIVFTQTTPYQTLTLTKGKEDLRLYIDRVIQFSSVDEYRYHEAIVHLPMRLAPYRKRVLILGGGEALAAREALKHTELELVRIVDIDPAIFDLARDNPHLSKLNGGVMDNPKLIPTTADAMVFLKENEERYDVIIADLPDPTNDNLARLYSEEFFRLVRRRLTPNGVFVTQATSPFHTTDAFWCIATTVEQAGFPQVYPYHAYVPSFGEWGFVMASNHELDLENVDFKNIPTRFLDSEMIPQLFFFEKDIRKADAFPSTLDHPVLLDYYLNDWERWSREKVMF